MKLALEAPPLLTLTIAGSDGSDIPLAQALEHMFGDAFGLDMTRRDLPLEARDNTGDKA